MRDNLPCVLLLVLMVTAALAHATVPKPKQSHSQSSGGRGQDAFKCTSNIDCQLNGVCSDGKCRCDDAWGGDDCGDLQLFPGSIAYGCQPASPLTCNVTSWGGGPPVFDDETNKWVFFVSEMAGHCGLSVWQRMSTIVRTVADNPEGPYVRDGLVIGAESHNAYYVQDPVSKMHLIFHIGSGVNSSSSHPWVSNCTNGTTPHPAQPAPASAAAPFPAGEDYSPEIHASKSLSGPFYRVNVTGVPAGKLPRGASNPAPFIFENGTTLVLFRVYNATPARHTSRIFVMRAPHYSGPYEVLGEVFHPPGFPHFNSSSDTHVTEEDPCIWQDHRSNFHNLNHFQHSHGFSEDGITWHWSGRSAWTTTIRNPDGSTEALHDSERPRVWVNPKTGRPELLFVASGGQHQPTVADGYSRGYTVVQRIKGS